MVAITGSMLSRASWGRVIIKTMSSQYMNSPYQNKTVRRRHYLYFGKPYIYQYRKSHFKDKTVWRSSHLYNGNPYIGKDGLKLKHSTVALCRFPAVINEYNVYDISKNRYNAWNIINNRRWRMIYKPDHKHMVSSITWSKGTENIVPDILAPQESV